MAGKLERLGNEMVSRIILHNSVSLDGSLTNFEPNMKLHYQIARNYNPDAHLIGSNTIKIGIELYGEGIPKEEEELKFNPHTARRKKGEF